MFDLIIPAWARYGAVALLSAALAGFVVAEIYQADIASLKRDYAQENASRFADALKINKEREDERRTLADKFAHADQIGFQSLKEKDDEIIRLRKLPANTVRLRVAATCPNTGRLPEATTASGVDHAASAELDPIARQAYFDLRDGINRQYEQLNACQQLLK
jgi:hypothetical protein